MAFARALWCLATGGCLTGAVVGATHGNFGDSDSSLYLSPKESFLRDLRKKEHCNPFLGFKDEQKPFGGIYMCSGKVDSQSKAILYYLEDEGEFDKLDLERQKPMDLLKEIKTFQYKSDTSSGYYLLLNFGTGGTEKTINLGSPSSQYWQAYSGFNQG